jgi:hypothetical protein
MPHPDHHARRAAQSARSLAKLAAIAGGNGRRTAFLGGRALVAETTAAESASATAANDAPADPAANPVDSAQATAARAWGTRRD